MTGSISLLAPAKLNLGLEILGRRDDGFHDIVTLFQTISLYDEVHLEPAASLHLSTADSALATDDNLALTALRALRAAGGTPAGALLRLTKRIPVAAGLGGASSDAAAALRAGRALWELPMTNAALAGIAAKLGSDVPFFIDGGTALGTGRGDTLAPLPALGGVWFVLVSPQIVIPRKTPTLYAALAEADFSDGGQVRSIAAALAAGTTGSDALVYPPNAFTRALYALRPELAELPDLMRAAGATSICLSGAGPTHFATFATLAAANTVAARLRETLGAGAAVMVAAPAVNPPAPSPRT